jgi:hypothetical protein
MLLSAVSVLVVAQPSLAVPEELMNDPVCTDIQERTDIKIEIMIKF